ncbi:hypothetical protein FX983_05671 [Pseudomonas frederiksbergensis]|uniref:Uncharacterized protein n=1 Tax=Pseudomonas frederiksbergensis TaxID=104087 RepID=A0A6L5BSH3_9PSED|nr:hypothetical protein FX983_05671 [Pseudomonas frederiksbergensis]
MNGWDQIVGASLLAKTAAHLASMSLTDRIREQARSHKGSEFGEVFLNGWDQIVGASLLAKTAAHPALMSLANCFREQARSHKGSGFGKVFLNGWNQIVGAGLLAKTAAHLASMSLADRIREQARSHRGISVRRGIWVWLTSTNPAHFPTGEKKPAEAGFSKTMSTPCRQRILAYGRSSVILSTSCASVDEARLRFGSNVQ